jgi:CDP-diacylglycerol--serine O-phosphatidyltransferase
VTLATSFCDFLQTTFVDSGLAPLLNQLDMPSERQQKHNILALKSALKKSSYRLGNLTKSEVVTDKVTVQPLIGYGRRGNQLNRAIRKLVQNSEQSLLIFTPYFNLPPSLARDVVKALKRGVKITLVVGDKTANDFYIANDDAFSTIGIVPYIYEMLLKRFVKRWQAFINDGLLNIHLWKDADNSFHLKGLVVDRRYHMLTGSNLNPRAWSLDLENGLLLDDPSEQLMVKVNQEVDEILMHTNKVMHYSDLQGVNDYPEKPKKLLKKIRMVQIDKLLKRFL